MFLFFFVTYILSEECPDDIEYTIPYDGTDETPSYSYCTLLETVIISDGFKRIRNYGFYRCSSLTNITIPNSVTSIGYSAFEYCSSLTNINIPNNVTSIGYGAFSWCSSLNCINVDPQNEYYSNYENDGILYDKDISTLIQCPGSKTAVNIPNIVTSIGSCAFSKCSSLEAIIIPNSVAAIGKYPFFNCSSLTNITILKRFQSRFGDIKSFNYY